MDLNTITAVAQPQSRADLPPWREGDAFLAGGTWIYSEPQAHLSRLIDLPSLNWPAITIGETHLTIAATCTVAQLDALACPPDWTAATLIPQCARAFLASFKIWKTATVGGNLCLSLPAGPMIALTAALDGQCLIWCPDGSERTLPVTQFVTGNIRNALRPGEMLRQIDIPLAALRRRAAFRQISLTPVGRSGALLIATLDADGTMALTVTGSTVRPIVLAFAQIPDPGALSSRLAADIPDALYHDDLHGKPVWRKAMTSRLAEELRCELQDVRA